MKVPWRVVSSNAYPDAALSVYVKASALAWRPEGCTAGVKVLASYLRMSPSTVERALRALSQPDPRDNVIELTSRRRTKPGGLGTTAERRVRPLHKRERFVWVPVVASELLEPRQLRAWAALAYAGTQDIQVSEAQLGEVLTHHTGKRSGQPIGPGAASAVIDSLERLGWLRVRRREGHQGRHSYETLDRPEIASCTDTKSTLVHDGDEGAQLWRAGDGSGSHFQDGSLATEEDLKIDGLVHEAGLNSSAVGEITHVEREASEETRDNPSFSKTPGLALCAEKNVAPPEPKPTKSRKRTYTGPQLTFSARLSWVMEPVACLVDKASVFVQRAFARQLAAQISDGLEPERLRSRLQSRFARTSPHSIHNVEGWLLKVASVRWGCHDPRCEEGIRWHSGEQCRECLTRRIELRMERDRQRLLNAGQCPQCRCRLDEDGGCSVCSRTRWTPPPGPPTNARTAVRSECAPELAPVDRPSQRCAGCRTGVKGECSACAVLEAVYSIEIASMDAAGFGLPPRKKLAAAAHARADVRRQVAAALEVAIASGLDENRQNEFLVEAANSAASYWTTYRFSDNQSLPT